MIVIDGAERESSTTKFTRLNLPGRAGHNHTAPGASCWSAHAGWSSVGCRPALSLHWMDYTRMDCGILKKMKTISTNFLLATRLPH